MCVCLHRLTQSSIRLLEQEERDVHSPNAAGSSDIASPWPLKLVRGLPFAPLPWKCHPGWRGSSVPEAEAAAWQIDEEQML